MRALELKVPPPFVLVLASLAMWRVSVRLPGWGFAFPGQMGAAWVVVGVAVLVGGLALRGFHRAKTTVDPLHPSRSTTLVTQGVYARSRNPMYLAMLLLLCSFGLYLGNFAALLFPPLFVLWMNALQIGPEERALAARFGEDYVRYCQRVRRWI